jgi:uncharacterized damage-inducible protein DinB
MRHLAFILISVIALKARRFRARSRKISPDQLERSFKVDWKGRSETDGANMLINMFVHAAHHRAQCEVYLRLKGFAPP